MADRYKVFQKANRVSAEKKSIAQLDVNVPYVVMAIRSFEHEEYGRSIKVNIRDCHKKQIFTYLPARISRKMDTSHIDGFADDIKNKRPPFMVYFGRSGQSFDVEFYAFDLEIARKALRGEAIKRNPQPDEETAEKDDLDWLDSAVEGTSDSQ